MEIKPIWTEEIQVRTYEVDYMGLWKPASFVQAMLEAAAHHATHFGFGYDKMFARESVWVLSRLKVKFIQYPTMNQAIVVKTWPKGFQQKLFFMRDFELRTGDGQQLALATFAWLLISPTARRILPPGALGASIPNNNGMSAIDEQLEKINPPEGLPELNKFQAGYSSVDVMGHANSARYVEWICDCYSQDKYDKQRLDWLQLNFVNETMPGEMLSIMAGEDPSNPAVTFVDGKNLSSDLRAFEAVLGWNLNSSYKRDITLLR
jgi:medium-chain acyl-[acyl-carrier-protein] hydrolase